MQPKDLFNKKKSIKNIIILKILKISKLLTSLDIDSRIREFETALIGNQEVASILAIAFTPLSKLNSLIESCTLRIN